MALDQSLTWNSGISLNVVRFQLIFAKITGHGWEHVTETPRWDFEEPHGRCQVVIVTMPKLQIEEFLTNKNSQWLLLEYLSFSLPQAMLLEGIYNLIILIYSNITRSLAKNRGCWRLLKWGRFASGFVPSGTSFQTTFTWDLCGGAILANWSPVKFSQKSILSQLANLPNSWPLVRTEPCLI